MSAMRRGPWLYQTTDVAQGPMGLYGLTMFTLLVVAILLALVNRASQVEVPADPPPRRDDPGPRRESSVRLPVNQSDTPELNITVSMSFNVASLRTPLVMRPMAARHKLFVPR